MNTRGFNGYYGSDSFAAMSGSRTIRTSNKSLDFVNLNFERRKIYERRIGLTAEGYEIGNLEANRFQIINKENSALQHLGTIGDVLHYNNLKTAVFGNSDTLDTNNRQSCLLAADKNGLIDYGNIDNILINDYDYPFGYKTDYEKLINEIERVRKEVSLIIIDLGDLYRLNLYKDSISRSMFFQHRKQILKDIDEFIGNLISKTSMDKAIYIITSPNSGENLIDDGKLSPLIIWDGNICKGVLTSQTTRRKGIVANIDFAPTVARFLDIPSEGFIGHNVVFIDEENNIDFIDNLRIRTNLVSRLRYPILSTYNLMSLIFIFLSLFLIFFNDKIKKKYLYNAKTLLISIMSVPPALLIISMFNIYTDFCYVFVFIFILIIMTLVVSRLFDKHSLLVISAISYLIILLDIIIEGRLVKFSVIGYDPSIGARYFGVGNELVGVFLASSMIFFGVFVDKFGKKYIGMFFIILAFLLTIHPNYGANFGGAISIGSGLLCILIMILDIKINLKKLLVIIGFSLTFIIIIAFFDTYINPNPSHFGQMILNIKDKGISYFFDIINRKILLNIKMVGISIWGRTLHFTILVLYLLIIKIQYSFSNFSKQKYCFYGFIALIFASTIGFIVNDSGVVLAAIANIYTVSSLIYITIEDIISN